MPADGDNSNSTDLTPELEETEEQVHDGDEIHDDESAAVSEMLALPELEPAQLNGEALRVVATTSIIGDVVAQVGGEAINLTVLMEPGQDPHSYEPAAQELTAVAGAHVIFVNGWDLEESLTNELDQISEDVPIIPISANIVPLALEEGEHESEEEEASHEYGGVDPHVWFSIPNVKQWVENVQGVLSDLDPANAGNYETNAAAYLADLEELENFALAQLAQIPEEDRFLVTNHESLGYFAQDYGFTVLGTVIPGLSTMAEPSAGELAALIALMEEHGICTIFNETSVSDALVQTVAAELDACDEVNVVKLYTGTLGPEGSNAASFMAMYRTNVDRIVEGLLN